MVKMAIYTHKCEQKWLKVNNRGGGGGGEKKWPGGGVIRGPGVIVFNSEAPSVVRQSFKVLFCSSNFFGGLDFDWKALFS